MTIRFLQTVASAVPGACYLPGQEILLTGRMTPEVQRWIADGRAELVRREPTVETAMLDTSARQQRVTRHRAVIV